jgi:hypothetical protein
VPCAVRREPGSCSRIEILAHLPRICGKLLSACKGDHEELLAKLLRAEGALKQRDGKRIWKRG